VVDGVEQFPYGQLLPVGFTQVVDLGAIGHDPGQGFGLPLRIPKNSTDELGWSGVGVR
jgi:hypothetical protein